MSNIDIKQTGWRLVEVGRVVIIRSGSDKGKLAAIVEIIDQGRALIDGPSKSGTVARQEIPLSAVQLTDIILTNLPKAAGAGVVAKIWEKDGIDSKWSGSARAKKEASQQRRRELTDFERFKVLRLKKQVSFDEPQDAPSPETMLAARFQVQKSFAKIRSTAKA